jgi:hypothetical protein
MSSLQLPILTEHFSMSGAFFAALTSVSADAMSEVEEEDASFSSFDGKSAGLDLLDSCTWRGGRKILTLPNGWRKDLGRPYLILKFDHGSENPSCSIFCYTVRNGVPERDKYDFRAHKLGRYRGTRGPGPTMTALQVLGA